MTKNLFLLSFLFILGCSMFNSDAKAKTSFSIKNMKNFGSVWGEGQKDSSVISQDGGFSNVVPEGSLWWFGDTFLGQRLPDGNFDTKGGLSCSMAILKKNDFDGKMPPELEYLADNSVAIQAIEYEKDEDQDKVRLWPQSAIFANGKYYVFFSYILKTGDGVWDFEGKGTGLAVSESAFSAYKRILNNSDFRYPVATPTQLILKDGYVYCYSIAESGKGLSLIRVKEIEIENPGAYEYFNSKKGFVKDSKERSVLFDDAYGQVSVVYNSYLECYLMATSSDFFHPLEIRFRTAPAPEGPWSDIVASIPLPGEAQNGKVSLIYCSYFHPELFKDNGRIMNMTYSMMMENRWFDVNNQMIEFEIEKR